MAKIHAIRQTFLDSGTWTSPPDYSGPVLVEGCGGGAGGGGGASSGGDAATYFSAMILVDPLTEYAVTVGDGGDGGASGGVNPGADGEDSAFGTLILSGAKVGGDGDSRKGVRFGSFGSGAGTGGKPGPYGNGGDGAVSYVGAGAAAAKNSGAGGGTGGDSMGSGPYEAGGKGGSGRLSVTWWV